MTRLSDEHDADRAVRTRPARGRPRSIATLVVVPGLVLLIALMAAGLGFVWWNEQRQTERESGILLREMAVAGTGDVAVRGGLIALSTAGNDPSGTALAAATATMEPIAAQVRQATGVDLVLVMTADGRLLSHPVPSQIGTVHEGAVRAAAGGPGAVQVQDDELGGTVLAVAPVLDGTRVVGLVGIGFTEQTVQDRALQRLWPLLLIGVVAIALGVLGVVAVGMWLRSKTLGLDAKSLARTVTYYDAGLDAGREGVLLVDPAGRLVVVNRPAREMLGWSRELVEGTATGDLGLPDELVQVLEQDVRVTDRPVLVGERVLLVTRRPAVRGTRRLGAVVTLEDHTELYSLADEVHQLEGFARALRLQAHESANRLHTVVSLIELGEARRAVELATADLQSAQSLADRMIDGVGDPALAALLLSKSAQAGERGIDLHLGDIRVPDGALRPLDLVTVVGNLLDNAMDAVDQNGQDRWVRFDAAVDDGVLVLTVTDSGPGVAESDLERVFEPGWSSKGQSGGRGLGLPLVRQTVRQRGGTVRTRVGPGGRFEVTIPVPEIAVAGPQGDR